MSPTRIRSALLVAAGLALVANATAVHAFDVGGERHRYDTVRLTATESGVEFGSDTPVDAVPDRIDGIDGLLTQQRPRLCAFEAHAVRTANTTVTVRVTAEGRFEVSRSSLSPAAARIVDSGPTTLRRPLPAHGRVVDTDDGYVIGGGDDPVRGKRPLRQAVAVVGQLRFGALLLRRGGRGFVALR